MKLVILISSILLGFSMNAQAGACDTNATSLDRNLANKCNSKTTKTLCESCADAEFNKVVVKIETCREKLQQTTDAYKAATCASKP